MKSNAFPPIISELPRVGLERIASILTKYMEGDKVLDTINLCRASVEAIKRGTPAPPRMMALLNRWNTTRDDGFPDYEVYASRLYLADIWGCWLIYSRTYLKTMWVKPWPAALKRMWDAQETLLDLGCGLGFSTVGLSQMYPKLHVSGTNMDNTIQWNVAKDVIGDRGTLVEIPTEHADIVFASEYFEHFHDPLDHLNDILDATTPNILVVANSFGTESIGHFESYCANQITGKAAAKQFTKLLRARGYRDVATKWWNNRPQVWVAE